MRCVRCGLEPRVELVQYIAFKRPPVFHAVNGAACKRTACALGSGGRWPRAVPILSWTNGSRHACAATDVIKLHFLVHNLAGIGVTGCTSGAESHYVLQAAWRISRYGAAVLDRAMPAIVGQHSTEVLAWSTQRLVSVSRVALTRIDQLSIVREVAGGQIVRVRA